MECEIRSPHREQQRDEKHIMRVPERIAQVRRPRDPAAKLREPQHEREHRERSGQQVKRTETEVPERESAR